MTMLQICMHERANMHMRYLLGYDQHDDHIWRWLNYHITNWATAHPIRVVSVTQRVNYNDDV